MKKEEQIQVVYLDVYHGKKPVVRLIKDNLDTFYKMLNATTIDVIRRPFKGKFFNVIVDDEGLLKKSPKVSAINYNYNPALVGNLIVTGVTNEDGELTGLTPDDVKLIFNCVYRLRTDDDFKGWYVLALG